MNSTAKTEEAQRLINIFRKTYLNSSILEEGELRGPVCNEICDNFGFSWMPPLKSFDVTEEIVSETTYPADISISQLEYIEKDPMFKNPRGVQLMCDAYNIDAYQFPSRCINEDSTDWDYVTLREDQNVLWASDYLKKGVVLMRSKRYQEAIKAYDQALALKSDYCDAFNLKGMALINLSVSAIISFWLG